LKEIATSFIKVLFLILKTGAKMSNLPVDRDKDYMKEMWGTTNLITDYWSLSKKEKTNAIDELTTHNLKKQSELHEKIRNDDDYDDWEYGTEPIYGIKLL
jgi:hypothetical protein